MDGLNVHYITPFKVMWYECTRIIWMDYMLQIILN